MIDDTEQRRDENRDATPDDRGDLLGRGVRMDPNLPPMTPTAGATVTPDALGSSEADEQRQAVMDLDRAHGRDPDTGSDF
ncbi:hypothetical protein [Deinococcus pimensis]|uniref:hypothetical protein n=1 Tax=Deinococcus pimensis TaxID=309888 RepID=UPI00047FEB7F|nr:hypothetical protein [Deinococcus pimensis]